MKKVLSVLLAVCMLAALAVPAFAWGADADVVKAEFDKAEYSLNDILTKNGGINVAELLTCYDKNNNRTCFDPDGKTTADIRAFNSSNNEVLSLNDDGTVKKIMNNKAYDVKVTLTVTLASGVRASTVIVVPANVKADGATGDAYGYRLADATVTKGSSITDPATKAVIKWTAPALKKGTLTIFGQDVALTADSTAAQVATAVAAKNTFFINGVSYAATVDKKDAKLVLFTAATAGVIPESDVPTDAQLEVTYAQTKPADLAGVATAGADAGANPATPATIKWTIAAVPGAGSVTVGDKTIALESDTAYGIATAIVNALDGTVVKFDGKDYNKFELTETGTGAAATVEVTATSVVIGAAATNPTKGMALAYTMKDVSVDAASFADGTGDSTPDALVYNVGDEITPILASYSFTGAQKGAFEFAVRVATGKNSKFAPVDEAGITQYGLNFKIEYVDGVPQLVVSDANNGDFKVGTYVYVRVLNKEFANAQIEKEFKIKLVNPASTAATTKILPVEKTIGVGQVLDLTTLHSSVKDVKTYWTVEPYGDYQTKTEADLAAKIIIETNDANTTYGWTVKGLAPSVVTVKLYDSYKDMLNGVPADSMKLNIGRGTVSGPSINANSASVKVGETVALNVKTTTADQYVKWSLSNENGTLDVLEGASVKLTGKTEGTVVVTATVYESKDSTVVEGKPLTATVEVKAAEAPAEGTTATQNPQTGDSIFAHLFF